MSQKWSIRKERLSQLLNNPATAGFIVDKRKQGGTVLTLVQTKEDPCLIIKKLVIGQGFFRAEVAEWSNARDCRSHT